MSEISLRPIIEADFPFLLQLYAHTREAELAMVDWPVEQKAAFVVQQFTAQHEHYQQHYRDTSWDVILLDGEPAGRFYVSRWATEIRVVDITLLPQHRGNGIGSHLFNMLFDEAAATGRKVSIHVEAFNPARRLYERLGFTVAADKDLYVLMERPA